VKPPPDAPDVTREVRPEKGWWVGLEGYFATLAVAGFIYGLVDGLRAHFSVGVAVAIGLVSGLWITVVYGAAAAVVSLVVSGIGRRPFLPVFRKAMWAAWLLAALAVAGLWRKSGK
jgi:hypothetical protein